MTVTVIRNGIGGTTGTPPTLNGQVGTLIDVLDHCLVTSLGWSKAYSGTNLAAYRAPTGNRAYLYVDDTGSTNARVYAYESMTSISTGVNRFPSETQVSGGGYIHKSTTADSTARNWIFLSNGVFFWLYTTPGNVATSFAQVSGFGDFTSLKSGSDQYNTFLMVQPGSGASTSSITGDYYAVTNSFTSTSSWVMRPYTGIGGSTAVHRVSDCRWGATSASSQVLGTGGATFPAPIQGGMLFSRMWIGEPPGDLRGRLPGWWNCFHTRPLPNGESFTGPTGSVIEGRTLEGLYNGNNGVHYFETSDTWD